MTETPDTLAAAPLGVTQSSSIMRLPANLRSAALRRISANANAPGGGKAQKSLPGWTVARAQKAALSRLNGTCGICAIESRPGSLTADVGVVNSQGVAVTLDTGGGTPGTTPITASELDTVTYSTGGAKTITVALVTSLYGEAVVTV